MKKITLIIPFLFSVILLSAQIWKPLDGGFKSRVRALEKDVTNNILYAAGDFVFKNNGDAALRLAKWNGITWTPLDPGVNGEVYALHLFNGNLYIGGGFNLSGTQTVNNIAMWNGTTFSPLAGGVAGGIVRSIVSFNGDIYAGGDFTSVNGDPSIAYIAKWNGTAWSKVGAGINSFVHDMAVNNSELYVVGDFSASGTTPMEFVGKWNGTAWSAVGAGTNASTYEVGVHNNEIYVSGAFNSPAEKIAKWNGTVWSALGSGLNNSAYEMYSFKNELYVGGLFLNAGASNADYIAKWNGSTWESVGNGLNNMVLAISDYGDSLHVGGLFDSSGTKALNYVAKLGLIATGINEFSSSTKSKVSPNPFSNVTTITFDKNLTLNNAELRIYDLIGKIVYTRKDIKESSIVIQKNQLKNGVYFYEVINDNRPVTNGKIVVSD